MSSTELLTVARPWLRLNGQRDGRLEEDLIRLEVRADSGGLARLEAVFMNWGSRKLGDAVDYVHFHRESLDFGHQLKVAFTVEGVETTVFSGLVTGIGAEYPELRPPELTLLAEDRLLALQMHQHSRVSENESDGGIIAAIAAQASLQLEAPPPGANHRQLLQFNRDELSALRARSHDALIRLEDGRLRVTPPVQESERPLKLSRENELIRFTVLADLAQQRGEVRVHGWDVTAKQAIHETSGAEAIRREATGGRLGPEVVDAVFPGAVLDLHPEAPATPAEARTLAETALRRRARRFVRGLGVTRGTPALRVGSRLDLVDLGPWFSGIYLVTAVTHAFDQVNGYRTHFEAQRAQIGGKP